MSSGSSAPRLPAATKGKTRGLTENPRAEGTAAKADESAQDRRRLGEHGGQRRRGLRGRSVTFRDAGRRRTYHQERHSATASTRELAREGSPDDAAETIQTFGDAVNFIQGAV